MARIGIFRKEIKDTATKIIVSSYSLPVGDKDATVEAVKKLLENDAYIFSVSKGVQYEYYLFSAVKNY
jgi:hypothetical protein